MMGMITYDLYIEGDMNHTVDACGLLMLDSS